MRMNTKCDGMEIKSEPIGMESIINYEDLFENAPVAYLVIDKKMDIIAANARFLDMTGFLANEVKNSRIAQYILPENFEALQKAINGLNPLHGRISLEIKLTKKDGEIISVRSDISAQKINADSTLYFLTLTESETLSQAQETANLGSKFESIFRCIPEPCLILNEEFQIIEWNDVAANLTGIGSRYAKYSLLEDLQIIGEDDIKYLHEIHEHTLAGNHTTATEFRVNTLDGEEVWLLLYSCPLAFRDEKYIFCMAVDISRRQKLLKEYEAVKKQLSAVLNAVTDLVFFKDKNSVYQGCNRAFEKYANLPESEIIGKTDSEISQRDAARRYMDDDRKMFESGSVTMSIEEDTLNDGRKIIFETIKSPIFSATDELIGMVGVSRDVTERKTLEAKQNEMLAELRKLNENNIMQLHKLNKLNLELSQSRKKLKQLNDTKDKFFSIIAHDLRNPFHLLRTISEMIITRYESMQADEIKDRVKDIHNSSNEAYKLLENLLTWSRSQTGRIRFEPARHDIYELIANSSYALRNHAKRKNITINQDVKIETVAQFDYNMIDTILRNLISNAIKFTNSGGTITVASSILDGKLMISVADNGVGISLEMQSKLFSISDSISTRGTSQEAGTGLGLILTKEFVDYHHGTITVESIPDKGSKFTIELPLNQAKFETTKMMGNADV